MPRLQTSRLRDLVGAVAPGGGVMPERWDDARIALLRDAWRNGGVDAAMIAFPDLKRSTLVATASQFSIPTALRAERGGVAAAQPKAATRVKLTAEQRLDARISAKKREIAQLAAQRQSIAAQEARRVAEREARAANRKTAKLEKKYAEMLARCEQLRKQIVAVKPSFAGPATASVGPTTVEPAPIAVPGGPLKATIDKGDTDVVRRRLTNFVVPQLVRDLRVAGPAVYACIAQLAKDATR